jgi:hypothetical protein
MEEKRLPNTGLPQQTVQYRNWGKQQKAIEDDSVQISRYYRSDTKHSTQTQTDRAIGSKYACVQKDMS